MIKGSKIVTAIVYIAIILLVLGIVGFILKLTNGGTDEFKLFYLTNENGDVYGSTDSEKVASKAETKFGVNYTFSDGKDFSVKILPNVTDETDFEYTVGGEPYKFSEIENLNAAFNVKLYDDYFTIEMPEDMSQVMKILYGDEVVEIPDGIDITRKPYFKMVVKSYNEKQAITIRLTRAFIHVEGLEIEPDDITV